MDDDLHYSNKFINDPAVSGGYGMTEELRKYKLKDEVLKPKYDTDKSSHLKENVVLDDDFNAKNLEKKLFVKEKRTVLSVDSNQRLFFDTNDITAGDDAAFENYFSGEQYEDFRRLWALLVGVQQDVVTYEEYRETNDIRVNIVTKQQSEAESNLARGSSTELCRQLIDSLVQTRSHVSGHADEENNNTVNANLLDLMIKIADDNSYSGVLAIVNELNAYAMAAATVNPDYFWRPFYYDIADKKAKIIIYNEQNPNNYTITLPRIINHVKSIRLLSTEIPNTINNITERNNIITLSLRYKQQTTDSSITVNGEYPYRPVELNTEKTLFNFILVKLDIGAYTIDSLIQHLEDKLNSTVGDQTVRRFGQVFRVTWTKSTGAIVIQCLRQELEFHLKFYSRITELQKVYNNLGELEGYTHGIITEFSHDLWYMLGFPWPYMIDEDTKDKYVQTQTNVVSFGAHPEFTKVHANNDIFDRTLQQVGKDGEPTSYTGPQYSELTLQQNLLTNGRYDSIQFMRPYRYPSITFKYIYLVLKGYKSMDHMNQHNVVVEFTERDFFAKVLLDSEKGAIAYNTFVSNPLIFTNAVDKITSLEVMWVDERGRIVDFGKVDHSFTLEFIHYITQNDTTGYDSRLGLIDKASYPEYLSGTDAKK